MPFIADLHVHSRNSRATSPEADLRGFHAWAQIKGISLVGTGDFTHPGWFSQIREELMEESGLLRFRNPPPNTALEGASPSGIPVRFILSAEISSIYKKKGSTRKVHSLLLAPSIEAVEKLNRKLARLGNIESDGRPILGLDPKILLELLLEAAPDAMLIPAHIWTPWFSVFGSKSGFDAIEDCFEELTPHIHALETGLSSDPPMNWRWSALDRFRLVSNSDAHSPANLGREANLIDAELSWAGVTGALSTGEGFLGTFEFHPEEGKYHADGHRKCGVRMEPEETARRGGLCPECGKPVTVGVLHRVHALADRAAPAQPRPAEGFRYLVPLPELLSEVAGSGRTSTAVQALYRRLITAFGSEYAVLFDAPLPDIEAGFGHLAAESVRRVREGRVAAEAGYDGEFGRITVFEPGEAETLRGQDELFTSLIPPRARRRLPEAPRAMLDRDGPEPDAKAAPSVPAALDPDQEAAVGSHAPAVVIFAGPGSGKTRVLAHWVAARLRENPEAPGALAVTFTNRAAAEMRERLAALLGERSRGVTAETFHSLCLSLLREADPDLSTLYGEAGREEILSLMLPGEARRRIHLLSEKLERILEGVEPADDEGEALLQRYLRRLDAMGAADVSSLVDLAVRLLRESPDRLRELRARFPIIAVDELQDVNAAQYEILRLIAGTEAGETSRPRRILCIGDPDQAIYSFRGSDSSLFLRLAGELCAVPMRLARNYRSTETIVRAAAAVLGAGADDAAVPAMDGRPALLPVRPGGARIIVHRAESPADEGRHIAQTIHALVGGVDAISADAFGDGGGRSFEDIAVLFRTRTVRDALLPALRARSIPCTTGEGSPVHAREPGRSLVAGLRLLANPEDLASLSCLLTRAGEGRAAPIAAHMLGTGTAVADLPARLRDQGAIGPEARERLEVVLGGRDALLALIASSGIVAAMDRLLTAVVLRDPEDPDADLDLDVLRETAAENGTDLPGFLRRLSLLTVESEGPVKSEKVRLLTFHAAKGLEFPVVFVAGAEEGITPMTGPFGESGRAADAREERRLFYVALTRAADRLFISHCGKRSVHGQWKDQAPSRFLSSLPADCVEALRTRTRRKDRQLPLFG